MTCCDGLISDSEVPTEYRTGLHSCFPQYFNFFERKKLGIFVSQIGTYSEMINFKVPWQNIFDDQSNSLLTDKEVSNYEPLTNS